MAWWIAAQVVRTTRQRRRLAAMADAVPDGPSLEVPHAVRSLAGRDIHLQFITEQLAALARIVFNRPWGLGFSDACLWTSDVPVVILNGHDDANQLRAAAFCDLILPLDPHRFLILPGSAPRGQDPEKRVDHLTKFDGSLGIWINSVIFDAADTHVYCHAEHDPLPLLGPHVTSPRLATPWKGDGPRSSPSYIVEYAALGRNLTVDRRCAERAPASADGRVITARKVSATFSSPATHMPQARPEGHGP